MTDRLLTPLIAVGLAFLVWMYTRSRDLEIIDNVEIPLEVAVAPAQAELFDLEVQGPTLVPVSFTGLPSRMRELRQMLQRGELRLQQTITVPEEHLADSRFTEAIRIDPTSLNLPPGVRAVVPENRGRIHVILRRLIERRLPVRLETAAPDRLENVILEPGEVLVRGPKEVLQNAEYIPTQFYTPAARTQGTEPVVQDTPTILPLVREMAGRPIRTTPGEVALRYTLRPKQRIYEIANVPVGFLCPANFRYRAEFTSDREGRVTLRVQGPAGQDRPSVVAFVDLTRREFGPGLHAEEPIQVQLPPGFQLAQETPRLSAFRLVAVEPSPRTPDQP